MADSHKLWRDLPIEVLAFDVLVTALFSLRRKDALMASFTLVEDGIDLAFWSDVRDVSILVVIGGMSSSLKRSSSAPAPGTAPTRPFLAFRSGSPSPS